MRRVFLTGEMLDPEIARRVLGGTWKQEDFSLEGYRSSKSFKEKEYLVKQEGARTDGVMAELEEEQLWRLDQWKDVPAIHRTERGRKEGQEPFFFYSPGMEEPKGWEPISLERQLEIFERKLELGGNKKNDLHLLYPCAVSHYEIGNDDEFVHSFSDITLQDREHFLAEQDDETELCEFFLNKLKQYNNEEMDGKFFRKIRRKPLGIVETVVTLGEEVFLQYAFAYVSIHPQTGVGMASLVFPALVVPMELQLCAFCSDSMKIRADNGELLTVSKWLKTKELTVYGSPKAAAFSFSPMEQKDILNCLACEMYPMGELTGDVMMQWGQENFAQYDIAEVYASDRCLLEISKMGCQVMKERLNVEAVEIFFLELLMMQEAAIARVSDRTYEIFNEGLFRETASNMQARLFSLSQEAANAVLFVNFKKLRFPTVRASAKRIAERFGVVEEMEHYQTCREMLEQMIAINTSESEKVEADLMNLLLLFLTMIQVLPLISDLARCLMTGSFTVMDALSSFWGAAGCLSLYLFYRLICRRREQKNRERRFGSR